MSTVLGLGLNLSTLEIGGDERQRLRSASKEVESMFLYMLLREMEKGLGEGDILFGGKGEEIYRDIKDMELSRYLSQRSVLGLGDLVYRSMEKFFDKGVLE